MYFICHVLPIGADVDVELEIIVVTIIRNRNFSLHTMQLDKRIINKVMHGTIIIIKNNIKNERRCRDIKIEKAQSKIVMLPQQQN